MIEEIGVEIWNESNRVECMMKFFGNFLKVFIKKDLFYYFVSLYNLFGVEYIEDFKIFEFLVKKVEKIVESLLEILKMLI